MSTARFVFAALFFAVTGSLWATPSNSGTTSKHYRVQESFEVGGNVNVRSLLTDQSSKALWVGTSVGALQVDLESKEIITTFTRNQGLANEYVFSLYQEKNGAIWFGTNGGGATRLYENRWKTLFPMHGLADYWVYAFGQQDDETLWIGTWNGVNRLDPQTEKLTTYIKELVNEWVYAIDVDNKNRVWFGTEGGVSMFDGKRWQEWTHADGLGAANEKRLPVSTNTGLGTRHRHNLNVMVSGEDSYNENYVFSLLVSDDNIVWVGTWGGGVSYFRPDKDSVWHNLTTKNGLAGNIVYSIAQDKNGNFWFGTDHGLSRYDGKNWETYSMKDGLLGSSVYAVAVTQDNHVWAGTRRGVAHLVPRVEGRM